MKCCEALFVHIHYKHNFRKGHWHQRALRSSPYTTWPTTPFL